MSAVNAAVDESDRSEEVVVPAAKPHSKDADWLAGRRVTPGAFWAAVAIGIGVVVLGYVFRSPLVPTDPWRYIRSTMDFPTHDWVPLGYTRYGMLFLSAPFVLLFGNAEAAFYSVPLLTAGVLAGTMFLLGRRWWGWVAGVVAVVLFFANPVVFLNLSRGYPDVPSMALIMFAALMALLARDRDFRGWVAIACLLLSGFALGMSFETRETSLLAWPLALVILWKRGSSLRAIGTVLVPLVAWAVTDIAIGARAYGDPLLKLHTLMGLGVATADPSGAPIDNPLVGQPRYSYFFQIPLAALEQAGGVWMVILGAIALLATLVRNRPLQLMSVSLASVYVLNVLAGGALTPDSPKGTLTTPRYWIQYFPMMYLVIGGLTALAAGYLAKRLGSGRDSSAGRRGTVLVAGLAALVVTGPLVSGIGFAQSHPSFAPNGGNALQQLRDHVRGQDLGQVWTDWETKRILTAYQHDFFGGRRVWDGTVMSLTGKGAPGSGDHVLLYSATSETCNHCRNALAPWLEKHPHVPPDWVVEFVTPTGNLVLYRVP